MANPAQDAAMRPGRVRPLHPPVVCTTLTAPPHMNRRAVRWCIAPLLAVLCLAACRPAGGGRTQGAQTLSRHTASRDALGTTFRLTVYAPDARRANEAIAAALKRLDEVDAALNPEKPGSDISALNAAGEGTPVKLGDDLFAVLRQAQRLAAVTRGSFDVTAGPYLDLWRRAAAAGRAPSAAELAEARLRVGWEKLDVNPIERSATLTVPRMRIDASGIARGYAVDQIFRQLRGHGCEQSKVETANVTVVGEAPPGRQGWTVTIYGLNSDGGRPRSLPLTRTAIAVSPNADILRNSTSADHPFVPRLIDPVAGRSLDDRPAAIVLATSGAAAESAAYAAAVLGLERADVLAAAEGAARVRFNPPPPPRTRRRHKRRPTGGRVGRIRRRGNDV